MAEERRRGAVDKINSAVDSARKIKTAYKLSRTAGAAVSTSEVWIPIVIVAVVILIIVFIILLSGGSGVGLGKEESTPEGGSPGSGNIFSCRFTRSGQQVNTIKSSILAGWINDAAISAGVPPAVLASVAMHENPGFLTTYDNNSPEITSNHFCGAEGINCTQNGQNIATRACTADEIRNGAETDRHRGLLQISSVFYPTVDACNITESLTWAAIKLKDYILTSTPTEAQVKAAVAAYGGFSRQPCNTHAGYPYDYCGEVWQDYQSCQAPIAADASSCPIPNGTITCGSKNRPVNGCGHCGVGYPRPDLCTYDGISYAMDIGGDNNESTFDPVYLPKINGHVIKWTFEDQVNGSTPPQAIQRYRGVDELTDERYFISLHHTQSGTGNRGANVVSGDIGARICANGCNENHVHVQLGRVIASGTDWLEGPDYLCKR